MNNVSENWFEVNKCTCCNKNMMTMLMVPFGQLKALG